MNRKSVKIYLLLLLGFPLFAVSAIAMEDEGYLLPEDQGGGAMQKQQGEELSKNAGAPENLRNSSLREESPERTNIRNGQDTNPMFLHIYHKNVPYPYTYNNGFISINLFSETA